MDIMNMFNTLMQCGTVDIPGKLAYVISMIIMLIQYGVPLLLIIFGMLDLGKAVIASKEDEIKKGQQTFIKRVVAAIIVFFIVAVVKLVVNLVADENDKDSIRNCINNIVNYHNVYDSSKDD